MDDVETGVHDTASGGDCGNWCTGYDKLREKVRDWFFDSIAGPLGLVG